MAFVLKQSDSYSWPVEWEIPIDGGRHQKISFEAQFSRVSQSRIEQIMADAVSDNIKDVIVANEVLVGWSGITENGEDVPYSEKTKSEILDFAGAATAIVKAWLKSLSGAQKKN